MGGTLLAGSYTAYSLCFLSNLEHRLLLECPVRTEMKTANKRALLFCVFKYSEYLGKRLILKQASN